MCIRFKRVACTACDMRRSSDARGSASMRRSRRLRGCVPVCLRLFQAPSASGAIRPLGLWPCISLRFNGLAIRACQQRLACLYPRFTGSPPPLLPLSPSILSSFPLPLFFLLRPSPLLPPLALLPPLSLPASLPFLTLSPSAGLPGAGEGAANAWHVDLGAYTADGTGKFGRPLSGAGLDMMLTTSHVLTSVEVEGRSPSLVARSHRVLAGRCLRVQGVGYRDRV